MADNEKQKEIFDSAKEYESYFEEDDKALDKLLISLTDLQNISNAQIKAMVDAAPGRGVQHNLIEHMANAISLASQFQSVLKDKRNIKEKSLDLAIKGSKDEVESSDMSEVIASMQKLIKEKHEQRKSTIENLEETILNADQPTDEELDEEIEKKLGL